MSEPGANRNTRNLKPNPAGLVIFLAAPWCLLIALLIVNPRYELTLLDPAMPGLSMLGGGFFVYLLGAATLFAAYGLLASLAQRNHWSPGRVRALSLSASCLVTLLCLTPIIILILLGPAAMVLLRAELPGS